jgi:hypothetical protein
MPFYMDTHRREGGIMTDDVVRAHQPGFRGRSPYDVDPLRYWVNEYSGSGHSPASQLPAVVVEGGARL